MNTQSRRNKIILAIAGVVVVVVIAVIALTQMNQGDLSGASTLLRITPNPFSVLKGATVSLSVNSLVGCDWSSSNTAIASFVGDKTKVKSVTISGVGAGNVTITAECGLLGLNHVHATGVVNVPITPTPSATPTRTPTRTPTSTPIPTGLWLSPANVTASRNQVIAYTVQNATPTNACTGWFSDKGFVTLPNTGGYSYRATLAVDGYAASGTGYVKVVCDGVELRASITVQ